MKAIGFSVPGVRGNGQHWVESNSIRPHWTVCISVSVCISIEHNSSVLVVKIPFKFSFRVTRARNISRQTIIVYKVAEVNMKSTPFTLLLMHVPGFIVWRIHKCTLLKKKWKKTIPVQPPPTIWLHSRI